MIPQLLFLEVELLEGSCERRPGPERAKHLYGIVLGMSMMGILIVSIDSLFRKRSSVTVSLVMKDIQAAFFHHSLQVMEGSSDSWLTLPN